MEEKRLNRLQSVVEKRQRNLIVVLEDIHDPHNAAAILRTCDAFGIQTVWFIFDKETPYNPRKLGKASSSSANKWLDIEIFSSTKTCIQTLKKKGYKTVVTALTDTSLSLEQFHGQQGKFAIVVGNEHAGVSNEMLAQADIVLTIPMMGFVQSLNVSVATAVVLWEITRQKLQSGEPYTLNTNEQKALLDTLKKRAK